MAWPCGDLYRLRRRSRRLSVNGPGRVIEVRAVPDDAWGLRRMERSRRSGSTREFRQSMEWGSDAPPCPCQLRCRDVVHRASCNIGVRAADHPGQDHDHDPGAFLGALRSRRHVRRQGFGRSRLHYRPQGRALPGRRRRVRRRADRPVRANGFVEGSQPGLLGDHRRRARTAVHSSTRSRADAAAGAGEAGASRGISARPFAGSKRDDDHAAIADAGFHGRSVDVAG